LEGVGVCQGFDYFSLVALIDITFIHKFANILFGDDNLEARMHRGWLNFLNGMELGNNIGVTFLEDIFHPMGTVISGEPTASPWN
jgi:hypothetical protein